jgi:enamine deaminase RidA (YjgF/YER057c/UK114 family)
VDRQLISSGSPYEHHIGLSRAVRVGPVIAVAGTAPLDHEGKTVHAGDVYAQTKRCLEITINAIERAGGAREHVVRTRIMLVDIARWRDAARAHGEVFSQVRPACTFVQVSGFIEPDWLVETEADCYVP